MVINCISNVEGGGDYEADFDYDNAVGTKTSLTSASPVVAEDEDEEGNFFVEKPVVSIRDYFPETWLWELEVIVSESHQR